MNQIWRVSGFRTPSQVGHFRKPNGTLFGYRDDLQREGGTFFGHHPGHFSIDEHTFIH
jgi:hypothetical protein